MTSDAVSPRKRDQESGRQLSPEQAAAAAMVAEAKARGLALTGPHGHPPVLRALSVQRKISLRSWFRPVFRLLVAMAPGARHPSGPLRRRPHAEVEREPVVEYERTVAELPAALDVARLPDVVRGYEEIKLGNLAAYRSSERLS